MVMADMVTVVTLEKLEPQNPLKISDMGTLHDYGCRWSV